jgi:hypothetical protein
VVAKSLDSLLSGAKRSSTACEPGAEISGCQSGIGFS